MQSMLLNAFQVPLSAAFQRHMALKCCPGIWDTYALGSWTA